MRKLLLVVVFIIPTLVFSQRRNRYKWEWIGGIGANNFLGAIGGSPNVGQHGFTGFQDWNWWSTRPTLTAGIRYKNSRHFAFKAALTYAEVYGSDTYTENYWRHNRNINFRSPIIELSAQVEYYPLKDQQGSLYRIKNTRGRKKLKIQPYAFVGLGGLYFNPQGQWNGTWYNLKPLSTEGEGLPGGPKEYSSLAISFPFGLGAKYSIDKLWSIGLEIGLHYTTTDYIDDTHGVYYPNNIILQDKGPIAAHFADPSITGAPYPGEGGQTAPGQLRGFDSHYNDAYIFGIVNVNYKILTRKRTRSKF